MKKLSHFLQYLKFYNEPNSKDLRTEAFTSAKQYYTQKPVRSVENPFPHPHEYVTRRNDFQTYQRAFINSYRHNYASAKLAASQGEK